jgi:peptidoglycan/xylan/chitin deacetylase (PgdA/CDA1 family)
VSGGVGGVDSWVKIDKLPNEPVMGWDDLKKLRDAGMEIGSHSATHARLDEASGDALRSEVEGSKATLESKLGTTISHFAYPQGRFSGEAEAAVKAAGYAAGWATRKGRRLASGDLTAIGRVPVSSYIRGGRFRWELFLMRLGLR